MSVIPPPDTQRYASLVAAMQLAGDAVSSEMYERVPGRNEAQPLPAWQCLKSLDDLDEEEDEVEDDEDEDLDDEEDEDEELDEEYDEDGDEEDDDEDEEELDEDFDEDEDDDEDEDEDEEEEDEDGGVKPLKMNAGGW